MGSPCHTVHWIGLQWQGSLTLPDQQGLDPIFLPRKNMHSTYHKISAKEREAAPRFYYKRKHHVTCLKRVRNVGRCLLSFLFTQVGVSALVAAYMVAGAFLFAFIEAESQMEQAVAAFHARAATARSLWNLTLHTNTIFEDVWKRRADQLVYAFQLETVDNVRSGYAGTEVGVKVWTFSSALMYSLTVFTTIGYGNLTPKTDIGKLTTMLYALVGIPLMLLYMTNIGHIMGTSFKYTYVKMCRRKKPNRAMPSKASLPSALAEIPSISYDNQLGLSHHHKRSAESSRSKTSSSAATTSANTTSSSAAEAAPKMCPQTLGQGQGEGTSDRGSDRHQQAASGSSDGQPYLLSIPAAGSCKSADEQAEAVQTAPPSPTNTPAGHDVHVSRDEGPPDTGQRPTSRGPLMRSLWSNCRRMGSKGSHQQQVVPAVATVEFKLVEDIRMVTVPVTSCLTVLCAYIVVGTVLFSNWEGWTYLDGAYFCFVSLMTIGFGDFVPGNRYIYFVSHGDTADYQEARAKLVLGTIYILLGMAIIAMCLNLMQEKVVLNVRNVARRLGLIRAASTFEYGEYGDE